jgi:hypothetical protein
VALDKLADVVAAELARVKALPSGAHLSSFNPPPEPLSRLRKAGRELDLRPPLPALLDGLTPAVVTAALERTCVVELVTGERVTARPERLSVDPDAVRWRPAQPLYAFTVQSRGGDENSRARGREHAAQQRASRKPPPGYITTGQAAEMIGLARSSSASVILRAIQRGELPAIQSAEGYRFVKPADVETWNRTLRRRGQGSRRPAALSV